MVTRVVTAAAFLLRATSAQSSMREFGTEDFVDCLAGVAVNGAGHVLAVGDLKFSSVTSDALVVSIPSVGSPPTTFVFGSSSEHEFLTGVSAAGSSDFVAVGEHIPFKILCLLNFCPKICLLASHAESITPRRT